MNGFWSAWVIGLIVLNLGIALFLFIWAQRVDIPTRPDGTTGHAWAHGVLRESVRRLPKWWVLISATSFALAFIYLALYPGFGAFAGLLGWTSHGEFHRDFTAEGERLDALYAQLDSRDLDQFASGHPLMAVGRRLYLDNCAACHGTDATGSVALGAPNLIDDVWQYGGDPQTVVTSILDGRRGVMPPWGDALGAEGVREVAQYVRVLGTDRAASPEHAAGKARYEATCAACHGLEGQGMAPLGAPNLADDDWMYGGSLEAVMTSIRDGRSGEMPAWRGRLTEQEARAIAAWLFTSGERGARTLPR